MSFELSQNITINKVNIRKKGPADARVLMIDVKLSAVTDPVILAHFDPTLRHFLFSDSGEPRMRNLKPIGWDGEMQHMELDIAGERFIGAQLAKFKFEALSSGHVSMSCIASVHPEGRQTAILADLAGDKVAIQIRPEPELDLQPKDDAITVTWPTAEKPATQSDNKPDLSKKPRMVNGHPVRYRHPQNPSLNWSGRGRQPAWVAHFINSGQGTLTDLEIGKGSAEA